MCLDCFTIMTQFVDNKCILAWDIFYLDLVERGDGVPTMIFPIVLYILTVCVSQFRRWRAERCYTGQWTFMTTKLTTWRDN